MNFWENPLKAYEANKVVLNDTVRREHYQEKIRERFKYNASEKVFDDYMRMGVEIYVFSPDELRKLLTSIKKG